MFSNKNIFLNILHIVSVVLVAFAMVPLKALANEDGFDPMGSLAEFSATITEATNDSLFISGYVNAHYMNHDGLPKFVGKDANRPLWQLREFSLFADLTLTDYLLFSTELEITYDFSEQNVSGRDRRLEALFNYYYADFDIASAFDWDTDRFGNLGLRAGRILVPFNSYNENKPNFKQNLMSQPFTAWQLVPVHNIPIEFKQFGWTDLGATLNWSYEFENAGIFDFKLSVVNGLGSDGPVLDSDTAQLDPPGMMNPTVRPRDGLGNAKSSWDSFSDNNDNKAVVLKASFAPSSFPVDIGVSWYSGEWDSNDDDDLDMYGAHFNYIEKNWSLKGEYVEAHVEQTAGINPVVPAGPAAINTSTGDYEMKAWYIEASYIPYRYGKNDSNYLKLIARYDDVDTNDEAVFTPFDRDRVTLGTEWEFIPNTRLRYEWSKNTLDDIENAPAPFIAAGGKEHVYMNMISLIANF